MLVDGQGLGASPETQALLTSDRRLRQVFVAGVQAAVAPVVVGELRAALEG